MNNFEVIASMGHCGTMWLSKVLDAGTDTDWYHEQRRRYGGPWVDALRLRPDHGRYRRYFTWLENNLHFSDVGDANSWVPLMLPEVDAIVPISRVIYLKRNPIQQLHSLTTKSYIWSRAPENLPFIVTVHLATLHQACAAIDSSLYDVHWDDWTHWEKLCLLVRANESMPWVLEGNGYNVEVYTLENLTADVDILRSLAPNLSPDEARQWQQRDINRKVRGDRSPEAIWQRWTQEQRDGFIRVVGEALSVEV